MLFEEFLYVRGFTLSKRAQRKSTSSVSCREFALSAREEDGATHRPTEKLPREVFGFERIHTTREGRQNGVEKRGWRLAHALATG